MDLSDFPEEDRPTLEEFFNWLKATGKCEGTWEAYRYSLSRVRSELSVPFGGASKKDMVGAIGSLRGSDLKKSTINTIISKLKRFYKWLNDDEGYPESVGWITTDRSSGVVLPDDLLSREEVREMADSCDHPRGKALIVTLFESGLRAHEFLALNIGSLEFDGGMGRIVLPKKDDQRYKTGQRRVPVAGSVSFLKDWINYHPSGGRGDPLWISFANGHYGDRLSHRGLDSLVRKSAKRAGIEKNVHPHLFRHSRATEIAGKGTYSEAEMRILFGWSEGSDMPSRYIHLSGADLDRKFRKEHGFDDVEEEEDQDPLEPVLCPDCGGRNPPGNSFCRVCGTELVSDDSEDVGESSDKVESGGISAEQMETVLEDSEVKEIIARKLKEVIV